MSALAAWMVLGLVAVEAVALWRLGQLDASLALTLASGSMLAIALLFALSGAPTPMLLAALGLAGLAHVFDMRARWR